MLVKGQIRGNIGWLIGHLSSMENNESVSVLDSNIGDDISHTLTCIGLMHGSDKRCVLHAKIALEPEKASTLTDENWKKILNQYIKFYNLENHAYTAIIHEKDNRKHLHIVVSAKDFNGKRFNDWQIFKRNMACQRVICEALPKLNLKPAQRGQDAEGKPKARSRLSDSDYRRESTNKPPEGLSADDVARRLSNTWKSTADLNGQERAAEFQGRLAKNGFALVNGNRGPGVVHKDDPTTFHHLGRRLGMTTKETKPLVVGLRLTEFDLSKRIDSNLLLDEQTRLARDTREKAQKRAKTEALGLEKARQAKLAQQAQEDEYKRIMREELRKTRKTQCAQAIDGHNAINMIRLNSEPKRKYTNQTMFNTLIKHDIKSHGVWKFPLDNSDRFTLKDTRETVAIYPDRISIHTRQIPHQKPSSDLAIKAMFQAAKLKEWKTISITGTDEFRKRSAVEAVNQGFKLADGDLQGHVDELREKANAESERKLSELMKKAWDDLQKQKEQEKIEERRQQMQSRNYTGPRFR